MNRFKIILYKEAITDFEDAFNYYKNISPALAKKFHSAVNSTFNALKKNPHYQIRYDDFRMKTITKFPYVLHFVVDEKNKTVLIYGIRNSYQNPEVSYFYKKKKNIPPY